MTLHTVPMESPVKRILILLVAFAALCVTTGTAAAGDPCPPGSGAGDYCEPEVIFGTSGDDAIDGSRFADVIFARGGDDEVFGGGGHDTIFGGSGDDALTGGAGNDEIHGGAGNDELSGGEGDDVIFSGTGEDEIACGDGADVVFASRFDHVADDCEIVL